jgi:hypothetical protein
LVDWLIGRLVDCELVSHNTAPPPQSHPLELAEVFVKMYENNASLFSMEKINTNFLRSLRFCFVSFA